MFISLGFAIHLIKSVLKPTQRPLFIGFTLPCVTLCEYSSHDSGTIFPDLTASARILNGNGTRTETDFTHVNDRIGAGSPARSVTHDLRLVWDSFQMRV